jgi:hypothetical protein
VLEAAFVLLEFSSPSRRIFIGSHSLPPLWFAVSVLQFSFCADYVLGVFLFQGLEKSLRLSGTLVVRLL